MDEMEELIEEAKNEGLTVIVCDLSEILSTSINDYIGLDYSLTHEQKLGKVHLATHMGYCHNGDFYNSSADPVLRSQGKARATRDAIRRLLPHEKIMEAVNAGCQEVYEIAEYWNLDEDFVQQACFYDKNGYLMD